MADHQPIQRDLFDTVPLPNTSDMRAYRAAQKAARIAAGLCVECGKFPRRLTAMTCEPCFLKRSAAQAAKYRAKLASEGKTLKRDFVGPHVSENNAAYKRQRKARLRASGVCTTCAGTRDVEGRIRCSACLQKDRVNYQRIGKARYRRRAKEVNGRSAEQKRDWIAAGFCSWCGGERDNPKRRHCSACSAYGRAARRKQKRRRRAKGLCQKCGIVPPLPNMHTCAACLEKSRAQYRREMERDPLKFLVRFHRRRARKAGNGGSFTALEWEAILRLCDHTCLMCRKKEPEVKLTVDHVIPVNQGGPSFAWNLQPLCGPCNKSKGDKHIDLRPNGPWFTLP